MGDIDVEAKLNAEFYRPFDQDRWLPPPPWKPDLPALVNWEAAHGHDVRMKCYVEYGCQAIQYEADALEAEVARLRAVVAGVEALAEELDAEAENARHAAQASRSPALAIACVAAAGMKPEIASRLRSVLSDTRQEEAK